MHAVDALDRWQKAVEELDAIRAVHGDDPGEWPGPRAMRVLDLVKWAAQDLTTTHARIWHEHAAR